LPFFERAGGNPPYSGVTGQNLIDPVRKNFLIISGIYGYEYTSPTLSMKDMGLIFYGIFHCMCSK